MTRKDNLTRREFIKGAAVAGASTAAAGLFNSFSTVPAVAAAVPDKWDKEADVVIVGFGGAGAVAAISAKDAGADVLLLEKDPADKHYCSTKMSGGSMHYGKDPQEAATYYRAMAFGVGLPKELGDPQQAYPLYPKDLIEDITQAWGKGVVEIAAWLKSLAPIDLTETIPSKSYPTFPGGKDYGMVSPVAKVGVVEKTSGQTLYKHLEDAVAARKINVLWETPGRQLVVNAQGEVVGVIAEQKGAPVAVKARRAVVLATGGFSYDEELRKSFLPGWKWSFLGSPSATGDGLRMAMTVGAALRRMHHAIGRPTAGAMLGEVGTGFNVSTSVAGAILTDNYGKRYVNEEWTTVDPPRYVLNSTVTLFDPSKLEYPRIPSWAIFDEKLRTKAPIVSTTYGAHATGLYKWSKDNSVEIEKGWILKGSTLDELAQKIAAHPENKGRMDAKVLKETIAKLNQFVQTGKDADFARSAKTLGPIDTPPFYATTMYPGAFIGGGPVRNAKAQLVNVLGKPVPRLYSAGELGSWLTFVYSTGAFLAECMIAGRIAGKNAASEKPWGST